MLSDSTLTSHGNNWGAGKERVRIGPAPAWAVQQPIPLEFKPGAPAHVHHLLWSRQRNVPARQEFVHEAVRLETNAAVELHSPWRLEFDPEIHQVVVHWVRTHRSSAVTDHAVRQSIRVVPKEESAAAGGGEVSLVLMLEDVRPGDLLEWCYTVEESSAAMDNSGTAFYHPPEGAAIGRFHVAIRYASGRALQWKASSGLAPDATADAGDTVLTWSRNNFVQPEREENAPAGHLYGHWIEISDYTGWGPIAEAFVKQWKEDPANSGVALLAKDVVAAESDPAAQAAKALRLMRDQFRRVSALAPLAGRPPQPPGDVVRRAYGSSPDLSFLLLHLLKKLGLEARLVLVNTKIGHSLPSLLPMPALFDRVIVEYKAGGVTRWMDPATRGDSGRNYGFGLPVAAGVRELVPSPPLDSTDGEYKVVETLLLDSSGATSLLAVVLQARGRFAEGLRDDLDRNGIAALSRARLESIRSRFGEARRATELQYRDKPAANEFVLAETFEVDGFLREDARSGWQRLELRPEQLPELLKVPPAGRRESPFALPYPCKVSHTLEIYCVALPPSAPQEQTVESAWLEFSRTRTTFAGCWVIETALETLAAAVPPDEVEEHESVVQEIRDLCRLQVSVPSGQERPHPRSDFGKLPGAVAHNAGSSIAAAAPAFATAPGDSPVRRKRRKRRRRRNHKRDTDLIWGVLLGGIVFAALIALLVSLVREFERSRPSIDSPNLQQPQ